MFKVEDAFGYLSNFNTTIQFSENVDIEINYDLDFQEHTSTVVKGSSVHQESIVKHDHLHCHTLVRRAIINLIRYTSALSRCKAIPFLYKE